MAYDPTKPVDDSLATAVELRDQFNALKALIDAQQSQITALQQQVVTSAPVLTANISTMSLDWTYNGPVCDIFDILVHQPNDAPGVFNDYDQAAGNLRAWHTEFDDPADAEGYAYYIVAMDGDGNPLTPPSNTASFVITPPSPGDLQAQVDALKARVDAQQVLIDQKASLADVNQAIAVNTAKNVDGFDEPDSNISDPPLTVEVAAILGKLDDLITALKH
jgi:hypothetical protein